MTRLIWLCTIGLSLGLRAESHSVSSLTSELRRWQGLRETPETLVQQIRLYYYLGKAKGVAPDIRRSYFEKGDELGKRVLQDHPTHAGALFWWGGNAGFLADIRHDLSSLSTIKEIRKALLLLKDTDPGYAHVGWARALGAVYHQAPGFLSIGSDRKAELYLRLAASEAPDFPGNLIALADFLWDTDRKSEAKLIAEKVRAKGDLDRGDFGEFSPEREAWRESVDRILGPPSRSTTSSGSNKP